MPSSRVIIPFQYMVTLFLSSPLAMSMDGCEEITLLTYKNVFIYKNRRQLVRGHGATVARLIPDQKVGCSNHPVLIFPFCNRIPRFHVSHVSSKPVIAFIFAHFVCTIYYAVHRLRSCCFWPLSFFGSFLWLYGSCCLYYFCQYVLIDMLWSF